MSFKVHTRPYCPYCVKATKLLTEKGITFEEISYPTKAEQEAFKERAGVETFPQVFFEDERIGGYDDLVASNESGALDVLADFDIDVVAAHLLPGSAG